MALYSHKRRLWDRKRWLVSYVGDDLPMWWCLYGLGFAVLDLSQIQIMDVATARRNYLMACLASPCTDGIAQ